MSGLIVDLFDEAQLEEIRLVTGDGFGELVSQFQANAVTAFAEIEASIAAGDAERLRKSAHRFKGSAATIGARAVADAAAQIEQAAKRRAMTESAELIEPLRKIFEQSGLHLQVMVASKAV